MLQPLRTQSCPGLQSECDAHAKDSMKQFKSKKAARKRMRSSTNGKKPSSSLDATPREQQTIKSEERTSPFKSPLPKKCRYYCGDDFTFGDDSEISENFVSDGMGERGTTPSTAADSKLCSPSEPPDPLPPPPCKYSELSVPLPRESGYTTPIHQDRRIAPLRAAPLDLLLGIGEPCDKRAATDCGRIEEDHLAREGPEWRTCGHDKSFEDEKTFTARKQMARLSLFPTGIGGDTDPLICESRSSNGCNTLRPPPPTPRKTWGEGAAGDNTIATISTPCAPARNTSHRNGGGASGTSKQRLRTPSPSNAGLFGTSARAQSIRWRTPEAPRRIKKQQSLARALALGEHQLVSSMCGEENHESGFFSGSEEHRVDRYTADDLVDPNEDLNVQWEMFTEESQPYPHSSVRVPMKPILYAARCSNPRCIEGLLKCGAIPTVTNDFGENALVALCAQPRPLPDMIKKEVDSRTIMVFPPAPIATATDIKLTEDWFSGGNSGKGEDRRSADYLSTAEIAEELASLKHKEMRLIAELLVIAGVDPKQKDARGCNAIDYAATFGHNEILQYLITESQKTNKSRKRAQLRMLVTGRKGKRWDTHKRFLAKNDQPKPSEASGDPADDEGWTPGDIVSPSAPSVANFPDTINYPSHLPTADTHGRKRRGRRLLPKGEMVKVHNEDSKEGGDDTCHDNTGFGTDENNLKHCALANNADPRILLEREV